MSETDARRRGTRDVSGRRRSDAERRGADGCATLGRPNVGKTRIEDVAGSRRLASVSLIVGSLFPNEAPPLRERPGDVSLLVAAFVEAASRGLHKPLRGASPEALAALDDRGA